MTETAAWVDRTNLLGTTGLASVYRMRDSAGIIIYIGETSQHLAERIRAHRTRGAGGSLWFSEVASVEAVEVPRNERQCLERAEIHRWHPVHNKVCVLCTQEARALLRERGFRGYLLNDLSAKNP